MSWVGDKTNETEHDIKLRVSCLGPSVTTTTDQPNLEQSLSSKLSHLENRVPYKLKIIFFQIYYRGFFAAYFSENNGLLVNCSVYPMFSGSVDITFLSKIALYSENTSFIKAMFFFCLYLSSKYFLS